MSKNFCKVDHKWCKFCKKTGCCYNELTELHFIRKCPKRVARETISLKTLINSVNFYDVMTELIKIWPKEKKNILGYANVYSKLKNMRGIKSNLFIDCYTETMYDGTDYECICYGVSGIDHSGKRWALDFTSWAEWLTMNITKNTLNNYSYEEIVAYCLYEMTFNGYKEEDIRSTYNKMIDDLNKCI